MSVSPAPPSDARGFWAVTLPVYLACLWLVSSAAGEDALWWFLGGLGLLAAAAVGFRRGRRRALYGLYAAALAAALAVGLSEVALRLFPRVLRGEAATHVYSGYELHPKGIYERDPHLGVIMRPGHRQWMYWSGHFWRHATNARGYRGPLLDRADVVVLGDSMIYGHGVEEDQTVPARLAARTGKRVANLGLQGSTTIQQELLFERLGLDLRPAAVVVSPHYNDVDEAVRGYPPAELRRYLATPPGTPARPAALCHWGPPPATLSGRLAEGWYRHAALSLRTARAIRVAWYLWRRPASASTASPVASWWTTDGRFLPPPALVQEPFAAASDTGPQGLAWQVNRHALRRLKGWCDAIGAELVVMDLGYPAAYSQAVETVARGLGVRYCPAGRTILRRAQAGEAMFLPGDGHWTPAACDLIAQELERALAQPRTPATRPAQ